MTHSASLLGAPETEAHIGEVSYRLLGEDELPLWDFFVENHPQASIYHLSRWRDILFRAFEKRWYVVGAIRDGSVCGGIPFVHLRSRFFGNFFVSMPYLNYGGLLVSEEEMANPILTCLVKVGKHSNVDHIELRHLQNCFPQLPVRTDKVSMWLPLPDSAEKLWQGFKPKLRSQVRKGEKNGLEVQIGGMELLNEFYSVFAHNMKILGTPVYGKEFFRLILEAFPETARLVVIRGNKSRAIASAFLLGYRERLEIPWASSLREYNYLQSNMYLYWNCLKLACQEGYRVFDFGRSTPGSNTFKFKTQWGANPVPHFWHYYLKGKDEVPQLNPQNSKFRLAITIWQKLPFLITRLIGPAIAKNLP